MGPEVGASSAATQNSIDRVLMGQAGYDVLPTAAQASVRAAWDEQISARISGLNFEDPLRDSGLAWIEADADGNLASP
jgi:hypothetical protein